MIQQSAALLSIYGRRVPGRVVAKFPVQARWSENSTGKEVVVSGDTESIGPANAHVYLRMLPPVGSVIRLEIAAEQGPLVEVLAEVLRVERDPAQPLAALSIIDGQQKWEEIVWESALLLSTQRGNAEEDEEEFLN